MWLIKYNSFFDTLVCVFNDKKHNKVVEDNNLTLLFNNEELVGINIKKPSIDKNKKYRLFDNELNKYVKDILKSKKINISDPYDCFIICKIKECEDVKGTNLKKCVVDIKEKKVQIVTNAKNAKKDLITVVSRPGAFLGDGTYINEGKVKDILSQGMFCSKDTLQIDGKYNEEGIIELNNMKDKIGQSFFKNI